MIKIRKGLPSDARDIKIAHCKAYQYNFRGYLPDEYLDTMPFDEAVIEKTASWIKMHEYYVAEKDNRVVGWLNLEYPEEKMVEILAFYVHPDFQKKGIGTALIEKICQKKKTEGYQKLVLWTLKEGPSLDFYKKRGLKLSQVPEKIWKFDLPIIRLEKEL